MGTRAARAPFSPTGICCANYSLEHVMLLLRDNIPIKWDFPGGSDGKASACNAGDPGSIPGSGRSPEEGMAARASILAWSKWAPGLRYFVSGLFVSVVWSGMTGFCQFAPQCGMHTIRGDYCLFIPSVARLDFC